MRKRNVIINNYLIINITNYIISAFPHKGIYFTKYHCTKEYIPHYLKNK
jgi:hypothetical protein